MSPRSRASRLLLLAALPLAIAGCTGDAGACGDAQEKTAKLESIQRRDMSGIPILELSLDVSDLCAREPAFVKTNVYVAKNETCPGNAVVLVHSTGTMREEDVYAVRESGGERFRSRSPWTVNDSDAREVGFVMSVRLPEPPAPELLPCVLDRVQVEEFALAYKKVR